MAPAVNASNPISNRMPALQLASSKNDSHCEATRGGVLAVELAQEEEDKEEEEHEDDGGGLCWNNLPAGALSFSVTAAAAGGVEDPVCRVFPGSSHEGSTRHGINAESGSLSMRRSE